MPIDYSQLRTAGTPCIVLQANQRKIGERIPADLPVVVDATGFVMEYDDGSFPRERLNILRDLHHFVSHGRPPSDRSGKIWVAWHNAMEEFELDKMPNWFGKDEEG